MALLCVGDIGMVKVCFGDGLEGLLKVEFMGGDWEIAPFYLIPSHIGVQ
jgi:hypothetical protein